MPNIIKQGNYTLKVMPLATMFSPFEVKVALDSVLSWSLHSIIVNLLVDPSRRMQDFPDGIVTFSLPTHTNKKNIMKKFVSQIQ